MFLKIQQQGVGGLQLQTLDLESPCSTRHPSFSSPVPPALSLEAQLWATEILSSESEEGIQLGKSGSGEELTVGLSV